MKTVLIFGGSGFVGKHIIRRLAKNGYKIIIPHNNHVNEAKLRLLGTTGQIIPIRFRSIKEQNILNLINKADVILNLKTLWDEKKTTFKKEILDFNINLVDNIKKNTPFIFFSGVGVDKDINSKRSDAVHKSEQYILKNLNRSIIIRPGVIIGGGDQFLKGLFLLFKISFFIPLFGNGLFKFQPVFVDDISIAIDKMIDTNFLDSNIYELVGPDIFTYKEFYQYLAKCMNKTRVLVPIPINIVKFGVFIFEKTPISPLNSEQLKLFTTDNIASNFNKKFEDLGVKPQDLKEVIKNIVIKNI